VNSGKRTRRAGFFEKWMNIERMKFFCRSSNGIGLILALVYSKNYPLKRIARQDGAHDLNQINIIHHSKARPFGHAAKSEFAVSGTPGGTGRRGPRKNAKGTKRRMEIRAISLFPILCFCAFLRQKQSRCFKPASG